MQISTDLMHNGDHKQSGAEFSQFTKNQVLNLPSILELAEQLSSAQVFQ